MSFQPFEQDYPFPQVFLVDGGGGGGQARPGVIPTWSFPRAQDEVRRRRRGCLGVSSRLVLLLLLLFGLVFASLGLGTVWTMNLQKEMKEVRRMVQAVNKSTELARMEPLIAQKQIGLKEEKEVKEERPAAHVVGGLHEDPKIKTLKWKPHVGRAFTSGGVAYAVEDGSLRVNQTGLYYIYCRVELIFRSCVSTSSFDHSVFVWRAGQEVRLMQAHRQGFCPRAQGQGQGHAHAHGWTTDSYLGSVLLLQKHDRVLVNVSHPDFLTHENYANFFGLYKV